MKPWKRIFLVSMILLTILSLLLSACGPVEKSQLDSNNGKDKDKDKNKENGKDRDSQADKISICHRTGSAKHPYVQIRVSNDAARDGHAKHKGDLIPAPKKGCPKTVPAQ